jgi:putative membrane protein
MIYYFAYFGIKVKYFPDLGGVDVAYVGASFFFISAFISLYAILPCLVYPGYYKNYRGWSFFCYNFSASLYDNSLYGGITEYQLE